jgi:NADH-quinone oxidoreductase subunit N
MILGTPISATADMAVGFLAMLVLVLSPLGEKREKPHLATLSIGGLLLVLFWLLIFGWGAQGEAFNRMFVLDAYAIYFKLALVLTAIFVLVMSVDYVKRFPGRDGEYYALVLFATQGAMLLTSAGNFLTLFLSLELMSLPFYILASFQRNQSRSVEAGLTYLVMGGVSTGVLLYGISFLYGMAGSTDFVTVGRWVAERGKLEPVLFVPVLMIIIGLGFKIASVPFHAWAPDVYEGSPTPITAFLSVGSKMAAFAILVRVLVHVFSPLRPQWVVLIALIAAATLLYGNLAAIPQKNIKRLLGYSTIGQAGYLLVGLAAANTLGIGAILFYLLAYLFSNLAVFLVVIAFSNVTQSDAIEDYAGLSRRSPLLAVTLALGLLSLAGVPPLAGFFGKFVILGAAVKEGMIWLAFVGSVCIVISLYYYLLVIKQMYLYKAKDDRPLPLPLSMRVVLYLCLLGILVIGIYPSPFIDAAVAASKLLF